MALSQFSDFANAGTVGRFSHIFQQKESVGQLSAQHNVLSPTLVTIVEGPRMAAHLFWVVHKSHGRSCLLHRCNGVRWID